MGTLTCISVAAADQASRKPHGRSSTFPRSVLIGSTKGIGKRIEESERVRVIGKLGVEEMERQREREREETTEMDGKRKVL
eukprot:548458-Amorphochlora_amoeboformis.AAC.2